MHFPGARKKETTIEETVFTNDENACACTHAEMQRADSALWLLCPVNEQELKAKKVNSPSELIRVIV